MRELTRAPADLAALAEFYAGLYTAEFPDPDERESLDNMARYLERKADGWYEANNYHIVLALSGGSVVAASVSDYLFAPNAGVIEFLLVSPSARGGGLGRAVLDHTESLLRQDARRQGRRGLHGIVAEMNDPRLVSPSVDNLDPVTRAKVWHSWGYRGLDFPYVQPALSAEQSPVEELIMICKSLHDEWAGSLAPDVVESVVHEYLRWAMRVHRPDDNPQFRTMAAFLARQERVPVLPLDRYVGSDEAAPLAVHAVEKADDDDFPGLMDLYGRVFSGALAIGEDDFRGALEHQADDVRYHLWAVRATAAEVAPAGLASFFTLSAAGFVGYVALTGHLRGSGRFPLLAARIEVQLLRDRPHVRGLYAEVGDHTPVEPFARLGFRQVDVDYRQPPVEGSSDDVPVRLLFKNTGRVYGTPRLTVGELLDDVAEFLAVVYGVESPRQHPSHRRVAASLGELGAGDAAPFVVPAARRP